MAHSQEKALWAVEVCKKSEPGVEPEWFAVMAFRTRALARSYCKGQRLSWLVKKSRIRLYTPAG